MVDATLNSRLWVPKSFFTHEELQRVKRALVVKPKVNKAFNPFAESDPVILYEENDKEIGLARHYGINLLRDRLNILDRRTDDSCSIEFHFNSTLWDTQTLPAKRLYTGLVSGVSNGGLLCVPAGGGKTIMALWTIAKIGAPTLIILHDNGLIEQWKNFLRDPKFLDLKDSDIGIVQQDKCDYKGKKVILASTKSIHNKIDDYPIDFFTYPTLTIYDEVHRAGARTFSTWMSKIRSKYILGLTATPRRLDKAENVFYYGIGDIISSGQAKRLTPKIYMVYLPQMCRDIKNKRGVYISPIMISYLAGTKTPKGKTKAISQPNPSSIRRNSYIAKDIVEAIKNNRKIIILSDRIPQLQELEKFITNRVKVTTGWYIGAISKTERELSKKAQVIFATFGMAKEGLDIPDLDTLAMITPKGDVEQAVGRILRFKEDKNIPLVLDYVDANEPFERLARKREQYYRANKYEISRIVRS